MADDAKARTSRTSADPRTRGRRTRREPHRSHARDDTPRGRRRDRSPTRRARSPSPRNGVRPRWRCRQSALPRLPTPTGRASARRAAPDRTGADPRRARGDDGASESAIDPSSRRPVVCGDWSESSALGARNVVAFAASTLRARECPTRGAETTQKVGFISPYSHVVTDRCAAVALNFATARQHAPAGEPADDRGRGAGGDKGRSVDNPRKVDLVDPVPFPNQNRRPPRAPASGGSVHGCGRDLKARARIGGTMCELVAGRRRSLVLLRKDDISACGLKPTQQGA